jgi:hypothetical protein
LIRTAILQIYLCMQRTIVASYRCGEPTDALWP